MTMLAAIVLAAITHVPADGTFRYPTNRCATAALVPAQVLGGCALDQVTNRRVGPETHASIIGSADAWFDRFVIATMTGTGRETNRAERVTRSMFDTGAITNLLNEGSVAWELAVPSNRDFRANGPRWNRRPVSVQDEALSGEYYALDIADYSPQRFLSQWTDSPDDLSIAWGSSAIPGFDTYSHPQWSSSFWSMRNDWDDLYPLYWSLSAFDGRRSYDFSRLFDNDQYLNVVWCQGEDPDFERMVRSSKGTSGVRGSTEELIRKVSGNSSVTNRFMEYFNGYNLNPIRRLIWSQWSAINGTLAALDRVYVTQDLCPRLSYTNEYCHGHRESTFDIVVDNITVEEDGAMDMSSCTVEIVGEHVGTNVITETTAYRSKTICFAAEDICGCDCGASAAMTQPWGGVSNLVASTSPGFHSILLDVYEDYWDPFVLWVAAWIDYDSEHGGTYIDKVDKLYRVGFTGLSGGLSLGSVASVTRTIATSDYDYADPGHAGIVASAPARYPHPASFELLADRNMQPEIFATCWEGLYAFGTESDYGNVVRINSLGPLRSVAEFNSAVRNESDGLVVNYQRRAINALGGKPCTVPGILNNRAEDLVRGQGAEKAQEAFRALGTVYASFTIGHDHERDGLLIEPDGTARIGHYEGGVFVDVPVVILVDYYSNQMPLVIDYDNVDCEYRGGLMTTASVHWNFNTMKRKP